MFKDHSLRFYVKSESLKEKGVIDEINSWPFVEIGHEGSTSFLQIAQSNLVDLPEEFIPAGLPKLFREIGTGKVSMKSIYRKPSEYLKDGLYVVGTTKVSVIGFHFMMVGDNHLAVIRAFKRVIHGRVNMVLDQSDSTLRKQIGKLQAANNQLRSECNKLDFRFKQAIRLANDDIQELNRKFRTEKDKVQLLQDELDWHKLPWWKRMFTPKPEYLVMTLEPAA